MLLTQPASARAIITPSDERSLGALWAAWLLQILVSALTVVVGFLVLYPIVMLLLGSFAPPRNVTNVWFSLDGYRTALFDLDARKAIVTTIWLSLVRAAMAVAVAVFLAWAITR